MIPSPNDPSVGRRVLMNTGALASSSLWRIGISFVLQLLIARRLGVEALGQYTVALAYLNVCQVVSELGFPSLLVRDLARKPEQRRGYFQIALGFQIGAALLTWIGLILVTLLLPFASLTQLVLWMVGASLPLYAVTSVCQTLFQAGERMEFVMGIEVAINALILLGSIGVLFSGGDVLVLIGVLVVTQAISAGLSISLLWRSRLLAPPQESVPIDLPVLWRRLSPFYGLALADVLLQRIDILLLSVVGGEVVTGLYSAAYNVVRVLLKLVQSYWQALYPTFSRLHHQSMQRYRRLCDVSLRYGLMLLLPCAALGSVSAVELLTLIYSEQYAAAAPTFRVLIWSAPLLLVEAYAVTLLMVEHRPKQSLLITGLHLAAVVLILPPFTAQWGAPGAAWAVLVAGAIGMACSLWLLAYLGTMPNLGRTGLLLFCALLSGAVALWLPLYWLINMAVGALFYGTLIWMTASFAPADIDLFRKALRAAKE